MSLVNLTDITPPERFDGVPFNRVQISEAPVSGGPYVVIDTLTLSPLDSDPTEPTPRSVTTLKAQINDGWYVYTWLDATGGVSDPSLGWQNTSNQGSSLKPSVTELGELMRARTVVAGSGGNEAGTFTPQTRPTAAEAQDLIDRASDMVLMQLGSQIPTRLYNQARWVVTLYAAELVELTFYRNEVSRDQSAFAEYQVMFKDAIAALKMAIEQTGPAAPGASFYSVPVINDQQARFHAMLNAVGPDGRFDPTLLPPDLWWPNGPGGLPAGWAWTGPDGLAFLEAP